MKCNLIFLAALALASTACSRYESDASVKGLNPAQYVKVNVKAFKAFDIWRDGQRAEILDYPQSYGVNDGSISSDGVFYTNAETYWPEGKFIAVPTGSVQVVNDVLEYPVRNGKQLKLKFTKVSEKAMTHAESVTYCKNLGLRLPTTRELFDFCAAGVTEPNYGPNFEMPKYPKSARCGFN